jgi:hypothetical protein
MHTLASIRPVEEIFRGRVIDLPEEPGVYAFWWVGKKAQLLSANIKKRFSLHIKRNCPGRLHRVLDDNKKLKPCTTSCQLRYGIEHVFRSAPKPLEIIFRSVGFSYSTDFPNDAIAERFYAEDKLVGTWRPWFNIDSER